MSGDAEASHEEEAEDGTGGESVSGTEDGEARGIEGGVTSGDEEHNEDEVELDVDASEAGTGQREKATRPRV